MTTNRGHEMGVLSGLARVLRFTLYPVVRPMGDAGRALGDMRKQAMAIQEQRRLAWQRELERRAGSAHNLAQLQEKGGLPAALAGIGKEDILDPRRITDDGLRFEALYRANGWSEEELRRQREAKRRAKRVGLGICVACFVLALLVLVASRSVLYPLLMTPIAFIGSVYGAVMALRMGLHQAQLEHRRLFGLKAYVARPDLFKHLLHY